MYNKFEIICVRRCLSVFSELVYATGNKQNMGDWPIFEGTSYSAYIIFILHIFYFEIISFCFFLSSRSCFKVFCRSF